ncbi:MAG: nuclear transport factor 2 family protein [Bacteroidota bacterium]
MRKVWLLALCAICICSCQQNGGQSDVAQANLTAASRYFSEVCNGGNLELVDELFTPDYVHTLTDGSTRTGTDTLKQMILIKKTGLRNLSMTVETATADAEKVMFLVKMEANNPGKGEHAPEKVTFYETFVFWLRAGKIYRGRTSGSHLELAKQIAGFEGGLGSVALALGAERATLEEEEEHHSHHHH